MRQFDVFTPADFASADFAQLFTCVVIVQFSSATTSLGTLQRLGAQLLLAHDPQTIGFVDKLMLDPNDINWIRAFPAQRADLQFLERVSDQVTGFESSWGRDGRSIAWSNAAGATAELNVAKSGSTHFDAFLTLSEPDHALDYAERRIPETRVMQASTDPLDAARTITVFLETTTAN
jgi:hypothetical protein